MKIRNINGTAPKTCKCGSWLKHWLNYSGQTIPGYCPEIMCIEDELIGAHVQKADTADSNWYIIPLCKKHNAAEDQVIEINDAYKLVPANVSQSCGIKTN
jgi:hypothetical protein